MGAKYVQFTRMAKALWSGTITDSHLADHVLLRQRDDCQAAWAEGIPGWGTVFQKNGSADGTYKKALQAGYLVDPAPMRRNVAEDATSLAKQNMDQVLFGLAGGHSKGQIIAGRAVTCGEISAEQKSMEPSN